MPTRINDQGLISPNACRCVVIDIPRYDRQIMNQREGPVFITDRGRTAHGLLSIDEYHRITSGHRKIADGLALPGVADIDCEAPQITIGIRPVDLS